MFARPPLVRGVEPRGGAWRAGKTNKKKAQGRVALAPLAPLALLASAVSAISQRRPLLGFQSPAVAEL